MPRARAVVEVAVVPVSASHSFLPSSSASILTGAGARGTWSCARRRRRCAGARLRRARQLQATQLRRSAEQLAIGGFHGSVVFAFDVPLAFTANRKLVSATLGTIAVPELFADWYTWTTMAPSLARRVATA